MSTQPGVRAQQICYGTGPRRILDQVSFEVAPGECLGITGTSGAGKSTLAKILATLVAPHAGRIWIGDHDTVGQPDVTRMQLGYLPQRAGVYRHLSVREHLEFFAKVYDRPASAVDGALELLELRALANELASKLPKAQRQRIHVARLLIHDPAILVIDEPLLGIESDAVSLWTGLLEELLGLGKCLIILAQRLRDLGHFCHQRMQLEHGQLRPCSPIESSAEVPPPTPPPSAEPLCWLQVRIAGDATPLAKLLEDLDSVRAVEVHGEWLHIRHVGGPTGTAELVSSIVRLGHHPLALNASAEHTASDRKKGGTP